MRIPRIYYPETLDINKIVTLTATNYVHVCKVLRLKIGANLILFNGTGFDYQGILLSLNKHQANIEILEKILIDTESSLKIRLAQGIARPVKMNIVIQKSIELGCTEIFPLLTQHCDIKQDAKLLEKRLLHWKSIVVSACEQCGRSMIPAVHPAQTFISWIDQSEHPATNLILDPTATQTFTTLSSLNSSIQLLIGSEGGFSSTELNYAIQNNFMPISLGNRILRTETATIAALSILQYLVQSHHNKIPRLKH